MTSFWTQARRSSVTDAVRIHSRAATGSLAYQLAAREGKDASRSRPLIEIGQPGRDAGRILYGGPTQVMPPMAGPPVINAGLSASVATDQRGVLRPQGSGLDNGVVEVADAGYEPAQLPLTYHSYDPATHPVVLRWKQLQGPYSVNSSADLNFGEAHDDTLAIDNGNGLTDEVTWPGEIQLTFIDPLAAGDLHFWRVIAE